MFAGRRFALIGTVAAAIWFVCVVVFWAIQPLNDTVPVGVDYTLKTPAAVSVSVDCQNLFEGDPRDDAVLPVLRAQPTGSPPLAFQREPCVLVHDHARIVFALDAVAFAAVLACLVWLVVRGRRSSPRRRFGADSGVVESLPA